ncbi:hydrolase [Paenibacillus tyrfis]|uniref:alpha/beta fold hydrolase n=1 Tax=Paenibacillus tyrfis TaxID=1501230 RepID=UPI002491C24E|nr:alpha/beta hydrolase [Paenibacillus tyrfis]GLI05936.1 hydrolase [Paenibacillus tyrfis]
MDLHYEIYGAGDETIVLLHGGGTDMRTWQFIIPRLAANYRVIAFDGRGAGQSPAPVEPANYVEDVKMVLDHFGLEKAILVGHSLGGQIAVDFDLTYPERVSKLVLIACSVTGFRNAPDIEERFQRVLAAAPDVEKMTEFSLDFPSYDVVKASPHLELMTEMIRHNIKRWFDWKSGESVWPQPPAIERLDRLAAPTLFMIGTLDRPDLFPLAEQFGQLPNARLVWIDGADHMLMLTHPDKVSHTILQFLEE